MKIIDGKQIAKNIKNELKKEIEENNLEPELAIILVGNNDASEVYVRNKIKACETIGMKSSLYRFSENDTEEDIINCIKELNDNSNIDGILVQSPLPKKFREDYVISFINPKKDVDGFGVFNMGCLATNKERFLSATPYGIIKMLEYENIDVTGKHVVIIGRSNIVGRPLVLALLNKDATVTVAHSKTKNLRDITNYADILVVAIGKPKFITSDYIKDGAVVIDVGINRDNGKLCGDVDFDDVAKKASLITPVPGGVGPMTIAMLLTNVVKSAKEKRNN